jgi:hypothetical protein
MSFLDLQLVSFHILRRLNLPRDKLPGVQRGGESHQRPGELQGGAPAS